MKNQERTNNDRGKIYKKNNELDKNMHATNNIWDNSPDNTFYSRFETKKNQTLCSHGITNIISKIKIIYMKINKINLFKTKNMANDRYY